MVVSLLVGVVRAEAQLGPGVLLGVLNRAAYGGLGGGFVTCVAARFAADGSVRMANAGHLAPYRNGVELALPPGLPLGLVGDAEYDEERLAAGKYVFVSDGVVEAANGQGELFGFSRTCELTGKPAKEIVRAAQAWGQNDDITVVTVQRG